MNQRKTTNIDPELHEWIKHNYLRHGFKTMTDLINAALTDFKDKYPEVTDIYEKQIDLRSGVLPGDDGPTNN